MVAVLAVVKAALLIVKLAKILSFENRSFSLSAFRGVSYLGG